jgi:hypothetical protein
MTLLAVESSLTFRFEKPFSAADVSDRVLPEEFMTIRTFASGDMVDGIIKTGNRK